MRPFPCIIALSLLTVMLLSLSAIAAGTGIKVFVPTESYVRADTLPFSYNSSFIVQNNGYLEGVYVVHIIVDDPVAITWINVTPSGFVLAPGETRVVNFSINIGQNQGSPGLYHIVFTPALLPLNVEPYLDTFANYISYVDKYNFTLEIPSTGEAGHLQAAGRTPVVFTEQPGRVNLVQYSLPVEDDRSLVQIDRAVRILVPSGAPVNQPVNISLDVFQGLSSRGIDLMAISPEGTYYPIQGENFTFWETGRWGVIAMVGDQILLGKPVDVSEGGVRLVMPGIGTILAAISLLLLLAVVPIWLMGRRTAAADPYDEIAYKAYVIRKYISQFDRPRLQRAVSQLRQEYNDLVARNVHGNRDNARTSLEELEILSSLELLTDGRGTGEPEVEG